MTVISKKRFLYVLYFLFTCFLAISLFFVFIEFSKLSNQILINLTFAIAIVWVLTGLVCLQFWYKFNYPAWKTILAFLFSLALIWTIVIIFDWISWERSTSKPTKIKK